MDAEPSAAELADRLRFLSGVAPFDAMAEGDREWLARRLRPERHEAGAAILEPGHGVVDRLCIIREGHVLGERTAAEVYVDQSLWVLAPGDLFPLRALVSGRPVLDAYRARERVLCLSLTGADFDELCGRSAEFRRHCLRRLAERLDHSLRVGQLRSLHSGQQAINAPLATLLRRAPVTCPPATPVGQVLETMDRLGIGSMVVVDEAERPLGIFTLHDVLRRVSLPGRDPATPISDLMTRDPIALAPEAAAHEAQQVMARHLVRHVLVVDGGRVRGVVSENDLHNLQRVNLRHVGSAIQAAVDLPALQQSARDIRRLTETMLIQGVAAEHLTQVISGLNDMLARRVVQMHFGDAERAGISHVWLALGSEGRYEQTLSSDQDNAVIFAPPAGLGADEAREILLGAARGANQALAECGFSLCPGNIMAGNPALCLTLDEWRERFADWIDTGTPEALLNAAIFFDFRSLAGDESLTESLRAWVLPRARANPRFLHQMARNALHSSPPLGIIRDFVLDGTGDQVHTLDLKLNGTKPFVDAARIYALAAGVAHTNTPERLRRAAVALRFPADEAEAWVQAFLVVQMLRLRGQQEAMARGAAGGNRVDPDRLNGLERRILKEAFRQARQLQQRLRLDYQV